MKLKKEGLPESWIEKVVAFDAWSGLFIGFPLFLTPENIIESIKYIFLNGSIMSIDGNFFNTVIESDSYQISIIKMIVSLIAPIYMILCFRLLTNALYTSFNMENIYSKSIIIHKPLKFLSMKYLLFFNRLYIGAEGDIYIADSKIVKKYLMLNYLIMAMWVLTSIFNNLATRSITFAETGYRIVWEHIINIKILLIFLISVLICLGINKEYLYLLYQKSKDTKQSDA